MSTGVGTLRKPSRSSLWPAAVVLSFVMLTVAVVVFSLDRGGSTTQAPSKQVAVQAPAAIVASGTSANTPSEVRAATVPTEGSGLRGHAGPAAGANAGTHPSEALGTNTPSEMTGGLQMPTPEEIRARELRRP
jgi:hypothetical protein